MRWLRSHLGTLVIVTIVAGAMVWLNSHVMKRDSSITLAPPITIGPAGAGYAPLLSTAIVSKSPLQVPMVVSAWGWPFNAVEKMEAGELNPDYAGNKAAIENSYQHGLKWNALKTAGDGAVFILVLISVAAVLENRIHRRRARIASASAGLMTRMLRGRKKKAECR